MEKHYQLMKPTPFTQYEGFAIEAIRISGICTIIGKYTTKEFINEEGHELYFIIGACGRGKSPSGRREFIDSAGKTKYHNSYATGLYIVNHNVTHYYFGAIHQGFYRQIDLKYLESPWIIQPVHSLIPALGKRNRKLIKRTIKKYLKTIGEQTCQTVTI